MYDYGTAGNMQHYNQPTPPQYDVKTIPSTVPIALFRYFQFLLSFLFTFGVLPSIFNI
jgi:hypothetical protein